MNYNYFMLIPLNLVYDEKYADVSVEAILMYSLFLNRTRFSMQNKKSKTKKEKFFIILTKKCHPECNEGSTKW